MSEPCDCESIPPKLSIVYSGDCQRECSFPLATVLREMEVTLVDLEGNEIPLTAEEKKDIIRKMIERVTVLPGSLCES